MVKWFWLFSRNRYLLEKKFISPITIYWNPYILYVQLPFATLLIAKKPCPEPYGLFTTSFIVGKFSDQCCASTGLRLKKNKQSNCNNHHLAYWRHHIPKIGDCLRMLNFQIVRFSSSHHKSQEKFTFHSVMILWKNYVETYSVPWPPHRKIAAFFPLTHSNDYM